MVKTLITSILIYIPIVLLILTIIKYKKDKEFRLYLKHTYYQLRYNLYDEYYWVTQNGKVFELFGRTIKRHDKIKFKTVTSRVFENGKYRYIEETFEGKVIGIDENKNLFVKIESGNIVQYSLDAIEEEDFLSHNGVDFSNVVSINNYR